MPKYYQYDAKDKNTYNEVTYESYLKRYIEKHPNFSDYLNEKKLSIPTNKQELQKLVSTCNKKINEYNFPKAKIIMHDPPVKPIASASQEEQMLYLIDMKKYEDDKSLTEKESRNNLKVTQPYIYISEMSQNCDKSIEDLFNNKVSTFANRIIKIPTSDEIYNTFKDKFNDDMKKNLRSQGRKDQLTELTSNIDGIAGSNANDDIKISKILTEILDTYREIIRSATGTPTLFGPGIALGKGSILADKLREFCRDVYDIKLPSKLEKGQPLAIDQPPLKDQNRVCMYFEELKKRDPVKESSLDETSSSNSTPRGPGK